MSDTPSEVTMVLRRAQAGDAEAAPRLCDLVYQKLHPMAEKKLSAAKA